MPESAVKRDFHLRLYGWIGTDPTGSWRDGGLVWGASRLVRSARQRLTVEVAGLIMRRRTHRRRRFLVPSPPGSKPPD